MPFAIPCLVAVPPLVAGMPPPLLLLELPVGATVAWFGLLLGLAGSATFLLSLAQSRRTRGRLRLVKNTRLRAEVLGLTR